MELKVFDKSMQPLIIPFFTKVYQENEKEIDPNGRHRHLTDVESYVKRCWCLFDNEELVGTVAIRFIANDICELKMLYLYEKYHGQGLGKMMMETAVTYAKECGFRTMILDTTATSLRAICLYEKYGFKRIDRYNDNVVADVFMKLDLTNLDIT